MGGGATVALEQAASGERPGPRVAEAGPMHSAWARSGRPVRSPPGGAGESGPGQKRKKGPNGSNQGGKSNSAEVRSNSRNPSDRGKDHDLPLQQRKGRGTRPGEREVWVDPYHLRPNGSEVRFRSPRVAQTTIPETQCGRHLKEPDTSSPDGGLERSLPTSHFEGPRVTVISKTGAGEALRSGCALLLPWEAVLRRRPGPKGERPRKVGGLGAQSGGRQRRERGQTER